MLHVTDHLLGFLTNSSTHSHWGPSVTERWWPLIFRPLGSGRQDVVTLPLRLQCNWSHVSIGHWNTAVHSPAVPLKYQSVLPLITSYSIAATNCLLPAQFVDWLSTGTGGLRNLPLLSSSTMLALRLLPRRDTALLRPVGGWPPLATHAS